MTTPEVVDLGDVVFAKRPALVSGASFFNLSCCLFKPRPFIGAGQGHRNLEFPDLVETSQFARSLRSPGIRGVQWVGRNYIQPGGVGERSPPKNPGTSSNRHGLMVTVSLCSARSYCQPRMPRSPGISRSVEPDAITKEDSA